MSASARRMPAAALWLVAAASLVACAFPGERPAGPPAVVKSPNDPRDYMHLALGNGLRVMLVSEPDAERAGAALAVGVGSGANPPARGGLAHFLEHMLFLGTEKYPEPGEYQRFIVEQGGRYNAYTAFDHTNYFFEVDAPALEPALDRFAQFFIAPLFQVEYVDRERNAVHAEYELGRTDDLRRQLDVMREAVSAGHPMGTFSVGNLETLGGPRDALRDALLAFYERHYSANRMTLVLFGPQPLATLRALAVSRFAAAPNRQLPAWRADAPIFAPGTLPARFDYVPHTERRELSLSFPTPSVYEHYDSRPLGYLAALLGDEGEGSLLSVLKRRGQATALAAGRGASYRGASMFDLSIELTERGMEEVDEVITSVFAAINGIRRAGIERWRFDERQRLDALGFEFAERGEPMGFVFGLAATMQRYPSHLALVGPVVATRFAPDLARSMLEWLVPENCLVMVAGKRRPVDRESRHYQTPYRRLGVDADTLARWRAAADSALSLPPANPFVPERAARRLADEARRRVPRVTSLGKRLRYWHRPAHDYPIPKTQLFLALRFAGNATEPHAVALSRLYADAVNAKLTEAAWPARLAGLSYGFGGHRNLMLSVGGFDERQHVLWPLLWDVLLDPALPEARFADVKKRLLRRLRDADKQRPFQHLLERLEQLVFLGGVGHVRIADAAERLSQQDLRRFADEWPQTVDMVGLVHGNTPAAAAREMMTAALARLPAVDGPRGQLVAALDPVRVAQLPAGADWRLSVDMPHADAALVRYFQAPDDSVAARVSMALARQLLRSDFFHELRTERQLGYVAFARNLAFREVGGLAFVIESPTASVPELHAETEAFLQRAEARLSAMAPDRFARHVEALRREWSQPPHNLHDLSNRYWADILSRDYALDHLADEVAALDAIKQAEWLAFFRRHVLSDARRMLSVHSGPNWPGGERIADAESFQGRVRHYEFSR